VAGRIVRIPRRVLNWRLYMYVDLIFFLDMGCPEGGVIMVICNSHIVS